MSYDPALARRVRAFFALGTAVHGRNVEERAMFGGLAFMLDGKMCCGVLGEDLVPRVGPDRWNDVLARRHVRPMDFTGRPMKGFVYVAPGGTRDDAALASWIGQGIDYVARLQLPAKTKKRLARRKPAGKPPA